MKVVRFKPCFPHQQAICCTTGLQSLFSPLIKVICYNTGLQTLFSSSIKVFHYNAGLQTMFSPSTSHLLKYRTTNHVLPTNKPSAVIQDYKPCFPHQQAICCTTGLQSLFSPLIKVICYNTGLQTLFSSSIKVFHYNAGLQTMFSPSTSHLLKYRTTNHVLPTNKPSAVIQDYKPCFPHQQAICCTTGLQTLFSSSIKVFQYDTELQTMFSTSTSHVL